ncbi:MAG: DUF4034 domain-containing protein [Puniceicoccales bacterium]|nr:DUF4034 domain-containing protein [Puniceicoccales bacterium]
MTTRMWLCAKSLRESSHTAYIWAARCRHRPWLAANDRITHKKRFATGKQLITIS